VQQTTTAQLQPLRRQPPLQLSPSKRPLSHAEPQPTCMQLKRTKWCSFVFLTMDRNMTKKMMRGANWEPK
jgi:hypothetical protein